VPADMWRVVNPPLFSTLNQLRNLGVKIALDDFGAGWSSMSPLRRFRFDKLKIDRSFIHDLSDQSEGEAILRVLAELAKSLRMMATAEGWRRRLSAKGCATSAGPRCRATSIANPCRSATCGSSWPPARLARPSRNGKLARRSGPRSKA